MIQCRRCNILCFCGKFLVYWLPVLLYGLLIFIQSSLPASKHIPEFGFADKLLHGGGYAVLGFLLFRAFNSMERRFNKTELVVLSIVLASLYGASDEIHQYFVSSRSAELMDFLADFIGSIVGVVVAVAFFKEKQPGNRQHRP